jgi:transposase
MVMKDACTAYPQLEPGKKQEKFERELTSLKEGFSKSRCLKASQLVEQKIGRLKEKHKRIARFYKIRAEHCEETGNAQNLSWEVDQEKINNDFGGGYYLRTSVQNVSEEKLWRLYTMLSQVESAFEEMKSTLGLRPVYHQLEHRTDGHMWITLLAYHLTHTIRYQLQEHGIDLSWKSIRDIMRTQVRVSTKVNQSDGKTCHIRTTTEAEPMQKKILQALGLPFKALKRLIVEC